MRTLFPLLPAVLLAGAGMLGLCRGINVFDALTRGAAEGIRLLGLGNAATPPGIRSAVRLRERSGSQTASDELCRLVVMNTASLQIFPMTVASLRSALGAAAPFDILPAVWVTSLVSVAAGLAAERALRVFS